MSMYVCVREKELHNTNDIYYICSNLIINPYKNILYR